MDPLVEFKTMGPPIRNWMRRSARSAIGGLLIALVLGLFGLSRTMQAAEGDVGNGNTAEGAGALQGLTTGTNNTALGASTLFSLTTGSFNTATGAQALKNNTADKNTADGFQALVNNTTGTRNMANGWRALFQNTTGNDNTADGFQALNSNTTGSDNTANGSGALFSHIGGNANTATGFQALFHNTTGQQNTAIGQQALFANTTASLNTAHGFRALNQSRGSSNTASGSDALTINTTGGNNTAVGADALDQNTTGSNNIALGTSAGSNLTTGSNNIDIDNGGVAGESGTIRIGGGAVAGFSGQTKTFIAGIRGRTTANTNAIPVLIDSAGQLGTMSSSRRFKEEIKPMDQASEAILALKPVTFHYKSDTTCAPQFGLIAEDVTEGNPDLIVRDGGGEIYTVRYDAVNAMLLNEFLKEHRKVQEQEKEITRLNSIATAEEAVIAAQQKKFETTAAQRQRKINALTARLKVQASQLQRVSGEIETSSPLRVPPLTTNKNKAGNE